MNKISSAQAAAVVAKGAEMIHILHDRVQDLENENQSLRTKVASYEREQLVEALATEMESKGLNADLSFAEKVASLHRTSDLSRVQEAVKMASSTGVSLANVSDGPGHANNSTDAYHAFLVTGSRD